MKKYSIITLILLSVFVMTGCESQDISYISNPYGYGLLDDTYVAKGSFRYDSEQPLNVNQVTLELYYLPSVWGEIEINENNQPAEDNLNFLIIDYNTLTQKVFAKYIYIGGTTWTAEIDNNQVVYVNQNNDDILEILSNEEEVKAYVEAIDLNDAYFLNFEMVMLNGYQSTLDTLEMGEIFQKVSTVQVVMINYAETLTTFPDLSTHYPDFDSNEVNAIFQKAYDKADDPEYRISVKYSE